MRNVDADYGLKPWSVVVNVGVLESLVIRRYINAEIFTDHDNVS